MIQKLPDQNYLSMFIVHSSGILHISRTFSQINFKEVTKMLCLEFYTLTEIRGKIWRQSRRNCSLVHWYMVISYCRSEEKFILVLNENIVIHSGHGEDSTIKLEKETNLFN